MEDWYPSIVLKKYFGPKLRYINSDQMRILFFKKAVYEVKASDLQLRFNKTLIAYNLAYNKNKLYKTLNDP